MGMVGQLYVRPRQNRVATAANLYTARAAQDGDLRTACVSANDILCSNPLPIANTGTTHTAGATYASRRDPAYSLTTTRMGVGLNPLHGFRVCGQFEITASTSMSARK